MVSERGPVLKDGGLRLRECPATPNCVNSQSGRPGCRVDPLPIVGSAVESWQRAGTAVRAIGGEVEKDDGVYLSAVFTSRFFHFKDDLELLLDAEAGVIHLRSASRLGGYDFGVNGKRVEKLRRAYHAK